MSYAESGVLVFWGMSIASGIWVGWYAKRALSFIALIVMLPIAVTVTMYLGEIYHMRLIGHSSSESWAGLVIPLVSARSFTIALPSALVVVGLKWAIACKGKAWRIKNKP
jgi:hypothetical protein